MTSTSALGQPQPSTVTVSHVVYALHAFAVVAGIVGTATVVGSFIGSVPSILAVVLSYLKRGSARGTWVESHYTWQIRTFWYALASFLIAWALIVTLIGAVIGIPILIVLTLWIVYRIARGWLRLLDQKPM